MTKADPIEMRQQHSGAARRLAGFAADLDYDALPGAVVARAKLSILDALGVGLAANAYPFADAAFMGTLALGGVGTASVIGRPEQLPLRDAALINGILIHGLDFDDTHLASIIHATAACLPAILSFGESLDSSGKEGLVAYALGAETAIRIGLAVKGGFHHVGFHATGVVAHFASALAAGKLLGLDADRLTAAQGIAASTASGVQVFLEEGAWTKRFHPGWAAVAGITAARLADNDFKGPERPYEGKFGLLETHLQAAAKDADLDALTRDLGGTWEIVDTAIKPYPVCHFIHGCADAAIALHAEIAGEEIVAVEAYLPEPTLHIVAEPAAAKQTASTDYEAKFSAPFVVATCLLKGRFGLPDLADAAIADERVQGLAKRVRCAADPETAFPTYFSGGVRVHLASGRTLWRHVRVNSGAPPNALDRDAVSAKFLASATMILPESQALRLQDCVLDLENRPIRELAAMLRKLA